jgi:hypothetical protein
VFGAGVEGTIKDFLKLLQMRGFYRL